METNDFNEPIGLVQYRDFCTRTFFKALICLVVFNQVGVNLQAASPFIALLWIFVPICLMATEVAKKKEAEEEAKAAAEEKEEAAAEKPEEAEEKEAAAE